MVDRYTKIILTVIAVNLTVMTIDNLSGKAISEAIAAQDVFVIDGDVTVDGMVEVQNSSTDPLYVIVVEQ